MKTKDESSGKTSGSAAAGAGGDPALYRLVSEHTGEGIGVYDRDGRVTYFNRRARERMGLPLDAIVGRTVRELFPPTEARVYEERLGRALASEAPLRYEDRVPTAGADARWFLSTYTRLLDDDGTPTGVIIVSTDITDEVAAREALRESERKYRTLADHAVDIVMRYDRALRHTYVSPNIAQHWHAPAEAFIGKSHRELGVDDAMADFWEERLQAVLDSGEPARHEFEFPGEDGPTVWEWNLVPERDADGAVVGVISSSRDITERRRAERARQQLEEQLLQARKMEALGRLAGGIAHDFNNLLTTIRGNAELLRLEAGDAPALVELVDEVADSADRAASLTGQLLAFSRKQIISPRPCDLNEILREQARLLARLLGEHIRLSVTPCPGAATVLVDRGQMEQVILNLAVNARDAMPDGGTLRITTRTKGTPEGRVELAVADEGAGIPADQLERVFDPFFTTKEAGRGTGLGLATVHGVVEQHGGTVTVDSAPGVGATFRVLLPPCDDPPNERPRAAEPDAVVTGVGVLLLVEDDPLVRRLADRGLRRAGYEVIAVESGRAALAVARERAGPIDLLVTDVVMPDMNGRDLADALLRERPGLPVLFTSGYTDDVIGRHGVLDDGTQFLAKPYTAAELTRRVRDVLDASA